MEKREWMEPTMERLLEMTKYPDKANEFGCKKVTEETYQAALLFLMRHMGENTPAPIIMPTLEGGILIQMLGYWVDLVLEVKPGGATSVKLSGDPAFFKANGYEIEDGPGLFSEKVFQAGVDLFEILKKKGPPDVRAKKPDDRGTPQASGSSGS